MQNQLSCSAPGVSKSKIVFLGDSATGKTSLIQRIITGVFDDRKQETIAIDFLKKDIIDGCHIHRLMLWDTAGQQKFNSLIKSYIRQADCAVIVYDISTDQSYKRCQKWLDFILNDHEKECSIIMLGNKTDLSKKCNKGEVQKYYHNKNVSAFLECSAKSGSGMEKLVRSMIQQSLRIKNGESTTKESERSTVKGSPSVLVASKSYKLRGPTKCCQI